MTSSTAEEIREVFAHRLPEAVFVFCDEMMRGAECYRLDRFYMVISPPEVMYPGLPRCIHLYPNAPDPCDVVFGGKWMQPGEPCFIFSPNNLKIILTDKKILATESYLRFSLKELPEVSSRGPCRLIGPEQKTHLHDFYRKANHQRFSDGSLRNGMFIGYFSNHRLVGAYGTHFINHKNRIAMTGFLYTEPAFRGRGIATTLVSRLTRELMKIADTIVCDIDPANSASIRLHQKLGFQRTSGGFTGLLVR